MPESWFWDPAERARFNAVVMEVLPTEEARWSLSASDLLHVEHPSQIPTCDEAIALLWAWQEKHLDN